MFFVSVGGFTPSHDLFLYVEIVIYSTGPVLKLSQYTISVFLQHTVFFRYSPTVSKQSVTFSIYEPALHNYGLSSIIMRVNSCIPVVLTVAIIIIVYCLHAIPISANLQFSPSLLHNIACILHGK